MRVGHALVVLGGVLLAMSIALFSTISRETRGPECSLLGIGWAIACYPYEAQREPGASLAAAYSCRD